MGKTRIEKDSLGPREIPAEVYYGIQTDRALENFPISGLREHPVFINAFIMLKKAAAVANMEAGGLAKDKGEAIVKACDEVLAGKLRDQFVVDVFQMGAGTSFNMNCNEVIANRANEILGGGLGTYDKVNPNDHVNFGQSTNDTIPTAIRLSALIQLRDSLHKPLVELEESFLAKGREFDRVLKSARTHLQDAVPIRLGQEFKAYGEAIKRCHQFLAKARESLLEIGIGGSAAGTGLNTAPGYREKIIKHLSEMTGFALKPSADMREAMQSQRPVAEVSSALRNLALEVTRIANDLRLLSSGPTTGFAEIDLPAVAPGSSIMPGKVNPSILEMTNMVCYQIMGCDLAIAMAVQAGQLELNVMMPLMAFNLNFMIHIFGNCLKQLNHYCVKGITAKEAQCRRFAEGSMGLATALNPYIGYARAAEVAKEALHSGKTIIEIIREKGILKEDEIARIMDPIKMTEPGIAGK
ncbi:MAG: aspartate ammonia-lyase [bacterium]